MWYPKIVPTFVPMKTKEIYEKRHPFNAVLDAAMYLSGMVLCVTIVSIIFWPSLFNTKTESNSLLMGLAIMAAFIHVNQVYQLVLPQKAGCDYH